MSSEIWKIDRDFCRCCHSRGVFTSLGEACTHIVPKQKYIDMLKDSLDVIISAIPGELSAATFKICDECASQLHAIVKFKKQVKICEDRFKDMYSRNLIELADTIDQPVIKVELIDDSEDDYKDFTDMDFDDDDDPILDIRKQVTKKVYAKNPKPKSKAKKPAKKAVKPKKTPKVEIEIDTENGVDADADAEADADAGAEADAGTDVKTEDADKKGGKTPPAPKFRLRNNLDFTQEGDILKCARCDKTYDKMFSLRFHVKYKHYKIPRYTCVYCESAFMTEAQFTTHKLDAHNVDDRHKCNACKGAFNTKVQLRKHINNFHMLGEKYKCQFCEYESFSFEGMYKHKFKHRTVKDYHCRFCRKSFLRKATLDLHERIHTGDRRKVCQVCGQAFVQKASLNYHMTKYHPEVNF